MKTFEIPWYYTDSRFQPGTVADVGQSIRLKLQQGENGNEYRLYLLIRTHKQDFVRDELKRGVRVATFKKRISLDNAQQKASEWFTRWLLSMVNDTNFYNVVNQ